MTKNKMPGFEEFDNEKAKIPEKLPVLPITDNVLYPNLTLPLIISSSEAQKLLDDVLSGHKIFAVAATKKPDLDKPLTSDLYEYGTAAKVLRLLKFPDGKTRLIVHGLRRIKTKRFIQEKPYFLAEIEIIKDVIEKSTEFEALLRSVANQFQRLISLQPYLPDELKIIILNIDNPILLADFVASNLNISLEEKQAILEAVNVKERLEKITVHLNREIELLEIGSKIQEQVQSEVGKNQREYLLREQLKAIQKELGEEESIEIKELQEKIKNAQMPQEAKKEAEKELERLKMMPPQAAEYTVSRTYLDWLTSLPWSKSTEDNLDIFFAKKVLDEDHYDLEKVKDRILEYLSVRKLKADMKGPILCFVGPPGVGKTSLGKSIARALGRKFIRISLGGVRDEAEIRGHRRTYVGALPGKIIQGINKAESNNPVFMLDEIDKIGTDFRGDPSSALLEVLDPEQNNSFTDHYLSVSFDLSKVMFITTANILDPIPPALKDRMEVIELPGYTIEEKILIAKTYLIPRQLTEHGLPKDGLQFNDEALEKIIQSYTKEAGLRNFEREIATICRKIAKNIAEGKDGLKKIVKDDLHEFLGPIKFFSEVSERTKEPGVATGLAWTPAGGDILFVESTMMKGGKGLTLTGQLGEVMKESAQAALSLIRSRTKKYKIDPDFFRKHDIHIHVPAGAIPKDGPSAGVTLTTSLFSLLTKKPVRNDIAMTGEITLRGKVLPVGGIKEKVLAAKRAGIKTVILPAKNKKDLEEVPQQFIKNLKFKFVENIDEIFETAFSSNKK